MKIFHYVNGSFVTKDSVFLSGFDTGILRGYGVFDYVQLYEGIPFHLETHLERLKKSAEAVGLSLPFSLEEICQLTFQLIAKNPPIYAGLRFLLTGGNVQEDLVDSTGCSFLILFHPLKPSPSYYYTHGLKALSTPTLRLFPSVKTTNYLPAILGLRQAKAKGWDEALYVTEKDTFLEATTSNLFFLKKGYLVTASHNIVEGVTRSILLELAKDLVPIELRSLHRDELADCQEAFLTSSVKDVIGLVQIDGEPIGSGAPGSFTEKLRQLYRSYINTYLRVYHANKHMQFT